MRSTSILLLTLAFLAGCKKQSANAPIVPPVQPLAGAGLYPLAGAAEPRVVMHDGLSAAQWSEKLNVRDLVAREQASVALAALKEDGFPHLVEGMRSQLWEVRLSCLQALSKPALVQQADQTLPILSQLLCDPNPLVRQQAAARVCWFGAQAKSALPALERLAIQDESLEVRQTAADAVVDMRTTAAELAQLLRDRSPLVRQRAAQDLGALQNYARNSLSALEAAAGSDPDEAVRQAAAAAAQSIIQASGR